jgi:hypothetical protein
MRVALPICCPVWFAPSKAEPRLIVCRNLALTVRHSPLFAFQLFLPHFKFVQTTEEELDASDHPENHDIHGKISKFSVREWPWYIWFRIRKGYAFLVTVLFKWGLPVGAVDWGNALQAGRSRDRILMVSLGFFPSALWSWVRISL